jgi:Lrp/AsnC family leucine-responsive transcriptional regulator
MSSCMVDDKDLAIIEILSENAEGTVQDIADTLKFRYDVSMPKSTVHARMRRLKETGVIKRVVAVPDYDEIGLSTTAFVLVSFSHGQVSQREVARGIAELKGVYEVHLISGDYDILVKVRSSSIKSIGELIIDKIREMKGVGKTTTCACFVTVKE